MPIFQFLNPTGQVVDKWYASASLAPDVGKSITIDGARCSRIISLGSQIGARTKEMCRGYPKISKTLPQYADGAEYVQDNGRDQGCPIIQSATHEAEMCKRHGFTREYHHTDEQLPIGLDA